MRSVISGIFLCALVSGWHPANGQLRTPFVSRVFESDLSCRMAMQPYAPERSDGAQPPKDKEESYPVTIEKIEGTPKNESKGIYVITVKIDKKVPNASGYLLFEDKKIAETDEYVPEKGAARLKDTDLIVLYLVSDIAPLGMKSPADLREKLPLKAKLHFRDPKDH